MLSLFNFFLLNEMCLFFREGYLSRFMKLIGISFPVFVHSFSLYSDYNVHSFR
jgi:hypothetical protein